MIDRYSIDTVFGIDKYYGTARATSAIRAAMSQGMISFTARTIKENERLDHVAGAEYDDGLLWWVIAAASNIGWGLQVPPGTMIKIPNLNDVIKVLSG